MPRFSRAELAHFPDLTTALGTFVNGVAGGGGLRPDVEGDREALPTELVAKPRT